MSTREIIKLAQDHGYQAKSFNDIVIISLKNRKVSTMEIWSELDLPREVCQSCSSGVIVQL